MRISFLHTVESNQRVFDDAAKTLGLPSGNLRHELRADLREAVQSAGAMSADVKAETVRCVQALAEDADAVIVTCATLGPAVGDGASAPAPIVRADVALAEAAAKAGGKIAVLCAVESTIEPNRKLFEQHASAAVTAIDVILVEPVWTLFKSGDMDACFAAIAQAANEAYAAGANVVAFAHPWMAPAAKLVQGGATPLDSVHAALHAAMQRANGAARWTGA